MRTSADALPRWGRPAGRPHRGALSRTVVLGGLVAWHLVQGAAPAWAHAAEQHPSTVEWATVAARCAVLVGGAVVAGVALLRPLAGRPNRARHTVVWTAAAVGAAGSVLSILQGVRPSAALTQATAIAAVPVLLRWRIAAVPAGALLLALLAGQSTPALWSPAFLVGIAHAVGAAVWLGAAVCVATGPRRTLLGRLAPASVVAGVAVAGTGLAQAYQDGIGLDERLYGTAFGRLLFLKSLVLLGCAAVGVLALRRKLPTAPVFRAEATVLAVAVVAGGVVATIPVPDPPPTPGVPLLREVTLADHRVPVLVTPHRPGWNLVHLGGEGTLGATVRTSPASPPVPAEERAGAPGRWALVELPAGRSTLRIEYYGQSAKVPVDTGHDRTAPAAITGPDGPECASMALGAAVAGARTPLLSCPSDRLDDRDAASLRALVGFLAHRGVPALTLVADASPRGTAAARAVRAAAARHGVAVRARPRKGGALVVTAGWPTAASTLAHLARSHEALATAGTYLAPWLLGAPVLKSGLAGFFPLRFNPHEVAPLQYAATVSARFHGEPPTAAGYAGWLAAKGSAVAGPPQLYAASHVAYMPVEATSHHAGSWLPDGTVTPVTGPLRES
ncbi:hypothetical protein [Carbonactinospora thermoautotrophica]|uniref:hypothetical protein n=1 Tax=Carbonactinospora thermoautotrophica TaxID=1469144 RepID=UPI00226DD493|nr:hypothetical protein [Carbonactinospora thermoautotrophica]